MPPQPFPEKDPTAATVTLLKKILGPDTTDGDATEKSDTAEIDKDEEASSKKPKATENDDKDESAPEKTDAPDNDKEGGDFSKKEESSSPWTWIGSIVLRLAPAFVTPGQIPTPMDIMQNGDHDIGDYLGGKTLFSHLYFCRRTYPTPYRLDGSLNEQDLHTTLKKLKAYVYEEATKQGSPIHSVGTGTSKKNANRRVFYCSACQKKRESPASRRRQTDPTVRRRKKRSARYTDRHCRFRFTIEWDMNGFYVALQGRIGSAVHEGHPREGLKLSEEESKSLAKPRKPLKKKAAAATTTNEAAATGDNAKKKANRQSQLPTKRKPSQQPNTKINESVPFNEKDDENAPVCLPVGTGDADNNLTGAATIDMAPWGGMQIETTGDITLIQQPPIATDNTLAPTAVMDRQPMYNPAPTITEPANRVVDNTVPNRVLEANRNAPYVMTDNLLFRLPTQTVDNSTTIYAARAPTLRDRFMPVVEEYLASVEASGNGEESFQVMQELLRSEATRLRGIPRLSNQTLFSTYQQQPQQQLQQLQQPQLQQPQPPPQQQLFFEDPNEHARKRFRGTNTTLQFYG